MTIIKMLEGDRIMKVKELLHKIEENPEYKDLDELSLIRKVYIEIGRNRTFDTKYYFGNTAMQKKIYKLAMPKIGIEQKADKSEIICYTLARQCEYIFNKLGYRCIVTCGLKPLDHVFNILTLKNGDRIKLDLQSDLEFIQTGRRTRAFGASDKNHILLKEISSEEVERADRNIGYPNKSGKYTDEVIYSAITGLSGLPLTERIERFVKNEDIINLSKNMGYVQQYSFYHKMLNRIAENEFSKKLFIIPCKTNKGEYTSCIFVKDKDEKVYLYSNKHARFLNVAIEKLPMLQEEGLTLGIRGKENGLKLLRKTINNRRKKLEDSEQSL